MSATFIYGQSWVGSYAGEMTQIYCVYEPTDIIFDAVSDAKHGTLLITYVSSYDNAFQTRDPKFWGLYNTLYKLQLT